jgi:hypothetical protein
MKYDLERARRAVEYLVATPYFPHRVKGLRNEVTKPRAKPYKDDAEPLNELLVIGRQNLQAMENLIAVAEYKRDNDRGEYQRKYMADMRRRHKLAAQLEERNTGHRMTLDERKDFALEIQAEWMEERDSYVARRQAQYIAQFNTEPGFEDKRAFIEQFWEIRERELEAMLSEPSSPEHSLRKRKRVVQVNPAGVSLTSSSAMAEAFKNLLKNRPK